MIDLGSEKHVTAAEVEAAVKVCDDAMDRYGVEIASIPVDNAARHVAAKVVERLKGVCRALVNRDCSHIIDLLMKDLAKTNVVKAVVKEAKEIKELVKIDRVDSIRTEAHREGLLDATWSCTEIVDTRMNTIYLFLAKVYKQHDFCQLLPSNPKFRQYLSERKPEKKEELNDIVFRCRDSLRWERIELLMNGLCKHFYVLQNICSREDFPLSGYLLLIQALRNDLNRGINVDNGLFDARFGAGSREEIVKMIRVRFNMDGHDPSGAKVGLLDRHHFWAFLVDPFTHEWRWRIKLLPPMSELVQEMIEHYVPLDSDGSSATRERVRADFEVRICVVFDSLHVFMLSHYTI